MKRAKRILSIVFILNLAGLTNKTFSQTYVTIPDSNFAAQLQIVIPTAMSGNKMDTSSPVVKNLTVLNVYNFNISNLYGVQFFPRLKSLLCFTNHLTNLPQLPDSLQTLACERNQLTSLPNLPNTLRYLDCSYNKLNSLPTLPKTLKLLYCQNNQLTTFASFPDSLTDLECNNNSISCFPPFPDSAALHRHFDISNNPFSCLPNYIKYMKSDILAYPLCNVGNPNDCPVSPDAPTQIIIPNIFTPNGDGINDEFFIKGNKLTNFSCSIFNRWGLLIYQWSDINGGWSGKDCTDGVYYYQVSYIDNIQKVNSKSGFLQLIK
jgi:gliding motility-associated-like protein